MANTPAAGGLSKGFGGASYADWAAFLYGVYQSRQKGDFQQVPMSPQQKQIFDWSFNYLRNAPDASKVLFPIAQHQLSNPSTLDVAALKAGNVGYKPGAPFDASKLTNSPSTTPPSTPQNMTPPTPDEYAKWYQEQYGTQPPGNTSGNESAYGGGLGKFSGGLGASALKNAISVQPRYAQANRPLEPRYY